MLLPQGHSEEIVWLIGAAVYIILLLSWATVVIDAVCMDHFG